MARLIAAAVLAAAAAGFAAGAAGAQELREALERVAGESPPADTIRVPPAPWRAIAGEVALGTALAAGTGYAVGLLAETFCDDCDASRPGGDAPGLAVGAPVGAFLGVWLIGRAHPPGGRLADAVMGALAGAAVFAGYASLLEGESDLVRWAGAVAPGAITAMAWNRSRGAMPGPGGGAGEVPRSALRVAVFELRF